MAPIRRQNVNQGPDNQGAAGAVVVTGRPPVAPSNRGSSTPGRSTGTTVASSPVSNPTDYQVLEDGTLKYVTNVVCESKDITWEVRNFRALSQMKDGFKNVKLSFEAGKTVDLPTKWCFFLRVEEDQLALYLKLADKKGLEGKEVLARYDTVIRRPGAGNVEVIRYPTEVIDMKTVADWGWSSLATIAKLVGNSPSNSMLVNDSLTIELKFFIFSRNIVTDSDVKMGLTTIKANSCNATLSSFENLLQSGENSDVTIICNDGGSVKAHKLILSARCPVFYAMFQSKMTEANTNKIDLTDMSTAAVRVLLKYIYTGQIDNKWKAIPEEVIYVADKYNLTFMKEYLDQSVATVCTSENALGLLRVCRLHNLSNATSKISEFIKSNVDGVLQNFQ